MIEVALGLDIGTGSTKAGLVDGTGRLLAVGRAPHRVDEPRPGWSETDPQAWEASVREAVAAVLDRAANELGEPVEVVTLGFSGQMHGVVVCGPDLAPLRPAVLWSDRRSQPDLAGLRDRLGPETGLRLANPVVAGMAGPTLAALRRLEPGTVEGIATVLQPKDWVRARLTGEVATDPSDASATLLWDVSADRWSEEACRVFGADPGWLAPVLGSAEVAGTVSVSAAADLGLAAALPVAVGAADTAAALLGAGVGVGESQLSTGTGAQLARLLDEPTLDPSTRTHLFRGAGDRSWYAMAAIQNGGIAIDWALGVLEAGPAEVDGVMAVETTGSGGPTFLPYLTGERTPHLDAGLTGTWLGLRSGTGRAALIRSVFEGVAFALRDGLDALRAAGHPIDRALLAGGGSVTPWWRQLLADALELPLVPHDAADASVRGAGLLAWAAVGVEIDATVAVERSTPIEPDRASVDRLASSRERFLAARPPV